MNSALQFITLTLLTLMLTNISVSASGEHQHHLAVFTGATTNTHYEHTDFTLGFDYELNLSQKFGAGIIGDFILAEHTETLLMGGIFYHPTTDFKIFVGNGISLAKEVEAELPDETNLEINEEEKTVSKYVLRIGTGYDFHVSRFTLTPTVAWDLVEGHSAIAYGITVGIGF